MAAARDDERLLTFLLEAENWLARHADETAPGAVRLLARCRAAQQELRGTAAPARDENLREWVATTLAVALEPAQLDASPEIIDTLTDVIECRAREIAGRALLGVLEARS